MLQRVRGIDQRSAPEKIRVAVVQMNASSDKRHNLKRTVKLVEEAIHRRAEFILLPEIFYFRGEIKDKSSIAEQIPGDTLQKFIRLAKNNKVYILAGSIYEKSPKSKKVFNTSVLISPSGKIIAKYQKINLFRATINRKKIDESKSLLSGNKYIQARVKNFNLGLSVCYDLRFPEIYRHYSRRGCNIISVPSCFTKQTGEAHWEVLLRARAIENMCYILAPNQWGKDNRGVEAYGNSLIIGPWGNVMARARSNRTEIIYATLTTKEIKRKYNILPDLRNSRKSR